MYDLYYIMQFQVNTIGLKKKEEDIYVYSAVPFVTSAALIQMQPSLLTFSFQQK